MRALSRIWLLDPTDIVAKRKSLPKRNYMPTNMSFDSNEEEYVILYVHDKIIT